MVVRRMLRIRTSYRTIGQLRRAVPAIIIPILEPHLIPEIKTYYRRSENVLESKVRF